MRATEFLSEAYDVSKARIDHPEDLVITNGSSGAAMAIGILEQSLNDPDNISIKPDGKPAIKWGRDSNGFAMGDKYMNPLPHSIEELESLLAKRRGGVNQYLLSLYSNLWNIFKNSVPGINGFLFGDLFYSSPPDVVDGHYIIKPNTVGYSIPVNSDLGRKVAASKAGIVVHTYLPVGSSIGTHVNRIKQVNGVDLDSQLLIIEDKITVPSLPKPNLSKLKSLVSKYKSSIDEFLDDGALREKKIKGVIPLLLKYINARVSQRNFDNMAQGFIGWIESNATPGAVANIKQHISEHSSGYAAMFEVFVILSNVKNQIIDQLDNLDSEMIATINGEKGHEGYLVHSSRGPIKLVNRFKFSAANFGA